VIEHCLIASVPLVPEIRLHLVTEDCSLWKASEAEAAALASSSPIGRSPGRVGKL
jgi:hypothetical protein